MRKLSFLLAVFFTAASVSAETVRATVKGMVCAFCAQGITKKFKAQAEVEKVDVNLEKAELALTLKEGKTLDDARIKELVLDSGYELEGIRRAKD